MNATARRINDHDEDADSLPAPRSNGHSSAMVEVASTRAAQEVQAAMVIAKRFPRDETAAINRITQACKRPGLAERAIYAYPKGGQTVEGPSIRLAEAMAQAWGNLDFGIVELEQRQGESTVMSYAWDLETNARSTKVFTVRHGIQTRKGFKDLVDPREIYELTANQGARRLRACILAVIPGDVVENAVEECNKTMKGNNKEPLIDRARKALAVFAEVGVTQQMVEKKIGHKLDAISEVELVNLRKIFVALRDGAANRDQFFDTSAAADVNAKLNDPVPSPTEPPTDESQIGGDETIEHGDEGKPAAAPAEIVEDSQRLVDELLAKDWDAVKPTLIDRLRDTVTPRLSRGDADRALSRLLKLNPEKTWPTLTIDQKRAIYAACGKGLEALAALTTGAN